MLLRKSPVNRRLTSEEVESRLKDVLLVLKYVNSKDIFMRVHKSHLMRRLILETSADNDMEMEMVERLRETGMPAEQVNKLSRMFQDIQVSMDLTNKFKEFVRNNTNCNSIINSSVPVNFDLVNIKILTSSAWLSPAKYDIALHCPVELEEYIPQIEEFYRSQHHGRKLSWQYHLSYGVISFTSDVGRFDLEVTTFQMFILLSWNRSPHEKHRLDYLLTATGLPENELRRTLWSLCEHSKLERQLILYSPKANSDKEFSLNTVFWLNLKFANVKQDKVQHRRRVNFIGRLQLTQDPSNEDDKAIVQLRHLRAQEAIVKVLKTRKKMHLNDLYKELMELLKSQFVPSKRLIKECIEWLMDKQYLRRDDKDNSVYHYIS